MSAHAPGIDMKLWKKIMSLRTGQQVVFYNDEGIGITAVVVLIVGNIALVTTPTEVYYLGPKHVSEFEALYTILKPGQFEISQPAAIAMLNAYRHLEANLMDVLRPLDYVMAAVTKLYEGNDFDVFQLVGDDLVIEPDVIAEAVEQGCKREGLGFG